MSSDLETLKSECRAGKIRSDSEIIAEGESLWLLGVPIPTEEGYIGLLVGEGHSVVFSEASILEVVKDRENYLVRVKAGSSAVVRLEAAVTLRGQSCECTEVAADSVTRTNTTTRQTGGGSGGDGTIFSDCRTICRFVNQCFNYVDKNGYWRQLCIPFPRCETKCM